MLNADQKIYCMATLPLERTFLPANPGIHCFTFAVARNAFGEMNFILLSTVLSVNGIDDFALNAVPNNQGIAKVNASLWFNFFVRFFCIFS